MGVFMRQERALTDDQITIFKEVQKELNEATQQAQIALNFAQEKQKSLNHIIALMSSFVGFDKTLVRLDLDKGVIYQDLP